MEIIAKCAKLCGHCNPFTLLQDEYELTCIGGGYNVKNEKINSLKYKEKKFINRLKYAEYKNFVIVEMFIKFLKVMIMIKYAKFSPH